MPPVSRYEKPILSACAIFYIYNLIYLFWEAYYLAEFPVRSEYSVYYSFQIEIPRQRSLKLALSAEKQERDTG